MVTFNQSHFKPRFLNLSLEQSSIERSIIFHGNWLHNTCPSTRKKHHQSYPKAFTVNTTHNTIRPTNIQRTRVTTHQSKRRLFHEGNFNGGLKYREISPSPKICIDHSRYAGATYWYVAIEVIFPNLKLLTTHSY